MSTGRVVDDSCVVIDSPQSGRPGFCRNVTPFSGQTQYKFSGIYPLPWNVQTSVTYQNLPGIPLGANVVFRNADIQGLGRNLSAASGQVSVGVWEPNQHFEDRLQQVDMRFSKIFRFGGARMKGMFDIYNMFNANTVLQVNSGFGPAWLRPNAILGARLFKFGAQLDF